MKNDRPMVMIKDCGGIVDFGRFSLDLRMRNLLRDGQPVEVGTRAIDTLVAFVEADGSWWASTR